MSFFDLWKNKKDDMIVALINDRALLQAEIQDLKKDNTNPHGWSITEDYHQIITGIYLPPNTCITPNDRKIKEYMSKKGMLGKDLKTTADLIEEDLFKTMRYSYDQDNNFHKGFIEWFQPASMSFALKVVDCDDFAILFQTMMHIAGFKTDSVCVCDLKNQVVWSNGKFIGHAWNKVLINGKWVDYDANAGPVNKNKVKYPLLEDSSYWFNYYGNYK